MPEVGPLGVNSGRGGPFAHAQAGVLVGAEEAPELEVFVARQALEPTSEVAPKHGDAADQRRVSRQAVEGHRQALMDKANVRNSAALVRFAFQHKLLG